MKSQSSGPGLRTLLGIVLIAIGLYVFFDHVVVTGGSWTAWGWGWGWGQVGFGWTLVPLGLGLGWMVAGRQARIGAAILVVGLAVLLADIIGGLRFVFSPVPLTAVLTMLAPVAIGLGLITRDLLPQRVDEG